MMSPTYSRILLVNDDPGKLATLKAELDDLGHDVVGCSTVTDAMPYAQSDPYAVALIDVQEPDEKGVKLLGLLSHMNGQIQVVVNATFQSIKSVQDTIHAESVTFFQNTDSSAAILKHVHRAFRVYATRSINELQTGIVTRTATLEEQHTRFQHLVEHIQEVFWIAQPDHSKILYMSPRYEGVWGRTCVTLVDHP